MSRARTSLFEDLPKRLATISILFPIVLFLLSSDVLAKIFFAVVHGCVCFEWASLEFPRQLKKRDLIRCGMYAITSSSFSVLLSSELHTFILVFGVSLLCCFSSHHLAVGLVIVGVPFREWVQISDDFGTTISLLLIAWICDTGALVGGRLAKFFVSDARHRIQLPKAIADISPNKTLEGMMSGIVFGTLTACLLVPRVVAPLLQERTSQFQEMWLETSLPYRAAMGCALSVVAIVGDLTESSIKRVFGVKDTGALLPGHGGLLDRFDSCLLVVLLYKWLQSSR